MMIDTLRYRLNDDFLRAEMRSGGRVVCVVEPVWGSDRFLVQVPGTKENERTAQGVVDDLAEMVASPGDFVLVLSERTTEITLERRKGKVSTRITDTRADVPMDKHFTSSAAGGTRQDFIRASEAKELFTAIGIMSPDGQIKGDKRRKLYQIDRFIELIAQMLELWPEGQELVVVDCGCGKSYLSFALNYYIYERLRKPCFFIGIDNNEKVIASSREIQRKLGYRNMEFVVSDVGNYRPERRVDMVLSLHACDTATDQALALGVDLNSKYIVAVPCCQSSLNDELDFGVLAPIARHNVFKTRLADAITDGLRVMGLESRGYRVSVAEYVSPLDTPKNIMLRAEYCGQIRSADAYHGLKAELKVEPWLDRLLEERRRQ